MARSSAALDDAINQAAVSFIEQRLKERKTVREILETMRTEPAFQEFGPARLLRCWTQVWRPMVAAAGRAPLPTRGGPRRREPMAQIARVQKADRQAWSGGHRSTLEAMLEALCGLLAEAPDSPTRAAALKALPEFVRAVRSAR